MNTNFFFIPAFFKIGGTKVPSESKESDKESLQQLRTYVIEWCIKNNFLIPNRNTDSYMPNIATTDLDSRLRVYIYSLNFKRLCIKSYLNELLMLLKDTEYDKTTSRLIDLHIQITTEMDSRYVNLYISKLIHTLKNLYPDDVFDHEWEVIFTKFPYLWLIYLIQVVMRQATPF